MAIISTQVEYVNDIDWKTLADEVEDRVMNKLHDDLAHWANDRSMRAMFLRDAADGLAVCELLAKGSWLPVENRLWDMDTAARDCVYEMIEAVAGADFFDIVR
jgi:hypothetical protein